MRRLRITNFEKPIDIASLSTLAIIVEDKKTFFDYCSYCYNDFRKTNVSFVYEREDKEIDCENAIHFIAHPFSLNLNTKKNINALYKLLRKKYYSELSSDIESLKEKVVEIVSSIALDFDVELTVNNEIAEDDLFKIMNLQFKEDEEVPLHVKFIKYMQVIYELQGINIFIMPFVSSYFPPCEIEIIKKELSYIGGTLISLENDTNIDKSGFEKTIILDLDLCTIE